LCSECTNRTSNRGFERKNFCSRVGDSEWRNPTAEDFDSRRIAERAPVGMFALTLLSGGNSFSGVSRHSPPSGGNPISGELLAASEREKSHHWGVWMDGLQWMDILPWMYVLPRMAVLPWMDILQRVDVLPWFRA